jgi:hypothetical protein
MNFLRLSVWLSFLEICAWMENFSHVLLVYACIGKIVDMWLTSITNFSDGGINTRYSPWVWWCQWQRFAATTSPTEHDAYGDLPPCSS